MQVCIPPHARQQRLVLVLSAVAGNTATSLPSVAITLPY